MRTGWRGGGWRVRAPPQIDGGLLTAVLSASLRVDNKSKSRTYRRENGPLINYFNYFTEIEDRFQRRRGSLLMLSTLDWALIETWREAGLPLEVVLRGIDAAFDKHEAQKLRVKGRQRKVNGLAWAAQAVLAAAEEMIEASTGARPVKVERESGFEEERVAVYLEGNAGRVEGAVGDRLRELAGAVRAGGMGMEELDRVLGVLEEKMVAGVLAGAGEEELVRLREQAAGELAPYRGKMGAVQIRQVEQQFLTKRLLEARGLPRLSLFYMGHG